MSPEDEAAETTPEGPATQEPSADGQATSGAGPQDPVQGDVDTAKRRWALAVGFIGWLSAIIAPAVSFDIELAIHSGAGPQFQAFFLIVSAVLFLVAWRALDHLPMWALGALAIASATAFIGYTLAKESWTCTYYPAVQPNRLVMGSVQLDPAKSFLAAHPPNPATCEALMENWGGDATQIWQWSGIVTRFLTLFGLYALAWLALALLVVGAIRRSLLNWKAT